MELWHPVKRQEAVVITPSAAALGSAGFGLPRLLALRLASIGCN